jgi:hypothetical protein
MSNFAFVREPRRPPWIIGGMALERPTRADRRSARRARNKRYVERRRRGQLAITVVIDESVVDLLIRTKWISESAAGDRRALETALQLMLKASASSRE